MTNRIFSKISLGETPKQDKLHIDFTHRRVKGNLTCVQFTDADTNMIVVYLPSLELSGYGDTAAEAHELLKDSLDEWFIHLLTKTREEVKKELNKFGWTQDQFRSKDFSKAYVDGAGVLQNMNPVEGSIKHMAIAI